MITITELKTADETVRAAVNALLLQLSSSGTQIYFSLLEEMVRDPDAVVLVVRDGEHIIGMGELVVMHTPTGRRGRIEDVVVDLAYRGKGLGRKLMEALVAAAKERSIQSIELSSRPSRVEANALYQKMGFEKKETNVYVMKL